MLRSHSIRSSRPAGCSPIFAVLGIAAVAAASVPSASGAILPAEDNRCYLIRETIDILQGPVARKTLAYDGAIDCLVRILRESYESFDNPRKVLLTGAMRATLVDGGAAAIARFRESDDVAVISHLGESVLSDDTDLRINATIILASVIDNSTVCIPIDYLYSLQGKYDPTSDNARFNLIGILGTLIPWSYQGNFTEIEEAFAAVRRDLADNPDYARTLTLMEETLRSGESYSGGSRKSAAPEALDPCSTYVYRFRP